jgi:sulfate adenylyltransferase subunit 1 (EFTu-like GTPase family)
MKNASLFLLIAVCLSACSSATTSNSDSIILFAEHSDNWLEQGEADWTFENGELVGIADSTVGYLVSKLAYKDFEISLEFKPDSTINSGVFVRCDTEINAGNCYEINIWDLHPNQDYRTGAVVTIAVPLAQVQTLNKWNTYKIICKKGRIQAWVNGIQTVDLVNELHSEGIIALQANGVGEIRFRNVELKELE